EYTFKHGLTCQVAYASLLAERRKELHRRTASAIEGLYADRLAEHYELLAQHFSRAEEWGKAFEYLVKAGEKMANAFGTREALAFYDLALEAAGRLGEAADLQAVMGVHQAKSTLYLVMSDFKRSRAEAERLLALARRATDRVAEGTALAGMGLAARYDHDFDRALQYSREAIDVAQEVNAQAVLARAHLTIGLIHLSSGRLNQGREELEQTLKISQLIGDAFHQSLALVYTGAHKNWQGEYQEASRLMSESVKIAREHNVPLPCVLGLWAHGIVLTGKGHYDEALTSFQEALGLAEKVGAEFVRLRCLNSLGWLLSELGDLDRANDLNRRGAEGARARGDPEVIANAEINLADVFLAKGDVDQSQEILDGVYRLVKNPATSDWMKWRYSTHLFASLGELWLARGGPSKAQEFADQCLEIATRTNSRKYLVKGWRLTGEIALARRQWDEAEGALRQALMIAQAIGNPTQLWKSHLAWGRFHAEAKRLEQARQAYHAAREVIDRIKASLRKPELRTSLERAPLIRQVYDLSPAD
ncbi:MAG: tetratricopeptide repeat protein, partial [Nitrospiraceae bacterium]